jgi:hypothetical protein
MLPKNESIDVPAAIQNVVRQHMVPLQISFSELEAEMNAYRYENKGVPRNGA